MSTVGVLSEYVTSHLYDGEVLSLRDSVKCELLKTAGAGCDQRSAGVWLVMWNSRTHGTGFNCRITCVWLRDRLISEAITEQLFRGSVLGCQHSRPELLNVIVNTIKISVQ
jgi:hypothetical protein